MNAESPDLSTRYRTLGDLYEKAVGLLVYSTGSASDEFGEGLALLENEGVEPGAHVGTMDKSLSGDARWVQRYEWLLGQMLVLGRADITGTDDAIHVDDTRYRRICNLHFMVGGGALPFGTDMREYFDTRDANNRNIEKRFDLEWAEKPEYVRQGSSHFAELFGRSHFVQGDVLSGRNVGLIHTRDDGVLDVHQGKFVAKDGTTFALVSGDDEVELDMSAVGKLYVEHGSKVTPTSFETLGKKRGWNERPVGPFSAKDHEGRKAIVLLPDPEAHQWQLLDGVVHADGAGAEFSLAVGDERHALNANDTMYMFVEPVDEASSA